jgi:predicted phage-related endonuclease
MNSGVRTKPHKYRRSFIGGSDARIIMGSDEAALVRLWREKRGEAELRRICQATLSCS